MQVSWCTKIRSSFDEEKLNTSTADWQVILWEDECCFMVLMLVLVIVILGSSRRPQTKQPDEMPEGDAWLGV